MRLSFLPLLVGSNEFESLLREIRNKNQIFDNSINSIKTRELSEINDIENKNQQIDIELKSIEDKYKIQPSSESFSLLERKDHHRLRSLQPVKLNLDAEIPLLEKLEQKREDAQRKFLEVEKSIVNMGNRITKHPQRNDDGDDDNGEE
jgi:hypothetical protein